MNCNWDKQQIEIKYENYILIYSEKDKEKYVTSGVELFRKN